MKLFSRKEIQDEKQKSLDSLRAKEASVVKSLTLKTKELNDTLPLIESKLKEKQEELAQMEFAHKTFFFQKEKEVKELEDRRLAALIPLEKERREIEDMKLETTRWLLQLGEKQLAVAAQMESLRRELSDMALERKNLEKVRSETLASIASEKEKASETIQASKNAVMALQAEREASQKAYETASERLKVAELAEMNVRAGMAAADERLLKEKFEQRKTDDKRKMLAIVVSELKKKGLWHGKLEKKING
jgi:hypothetical protein